MILNEAVTLLGYKVDERELKKYQRQIDKQQREALKLLSTREKAAKQQERANASLDEKLRRSAERQLNQEIANSAKIARQKQRDSDLHMRQQERMFRATERRLQQERRAFEREAARIRAAEERGLTARIRAAERAAAQTERINQRAARQAARQAEKQRNKSIAFLHGGGGGMGGLGMLGGALSVGGLMAGAKSVYDTGTSRESMLTGLKNLPGMNEQSALREFKRLQEFNTKTPFGLDEITSSYIRLRNMGLNASNEAMTAYGGIAASIPGKKINDFVEAVADGVMGEAERLKEFGIKMKVEGDKAAITFRGQTLRVNRDAKSIERALMDIGTKNFGNTMGDLAKTTGGQMSNLTDQIEDLKWQIWQGGMKQAVGELIKGFAKLLKQWMPIAREFAIVQRLNMPRYLKMFGDALPLINLGLGIMLARMTGLKMLAMAEWATKTAMAFKTLGAAQFFLNGGLGLMPTLIGGATLALGALIADFGYFMTTGDSAILKFTERWPELNKWIKEAYESNRIFIYAVQIGFERIQNWIRTYILPAYQDWWNGMKSIWEWMGPKIEWLLGRLGSVGNAVRDLGSMFGAFQGSGNGQSFWDMAARLGMSGEAGAGGGAPNAGNPLTNSGILGPGLAKNQKLGQSLAQLAPSIREVEKYCLRAVWRIQNAALGGTSKIEGGAAFQAADFLARDKRFKEVNFTPAMYKKMMEGDPQLKALMQGATVIYNRQSGFNPLSGHAEIWDTQKQKSFYGLGATSMQRSDQMINNARFFVPVQQQTMPVPAKKTQVSNLPPIMIEQTFNGQVSPAQVRGASDAGVQQGLHRASLSAAQGMA